MDFDNPKVYGDTFISDGLVEMESSCILYFLNARSYLAHCCAIFLLSGQLTRSYPSTEEPSVYERIVKELWDEAQRQLDCCGVETFADW